MVANFEDIEARRFVGIVVLTVDRVLDVTEE